jgi:predicted nucleic acid-binding protein
MLPRNGFVYVDTPVVVYTVERHPMRLLPVDLPAIRSATTLRANFGLKTPDAIHAATAREAGCTLFVTNDRHVRRVPGPNVAVLDDVLSA